MARRPRRRAAPVVVMAFPLTHGHPGFLPSLVAVYRRAVPIRMAQYTRFESGLNGQTATRANGGRRGTEAAYCFSSTSS
jgi:hypothetical protein